MHDPATPVPPRAGRAPFQRYRLIRRIARGGMAEVYLAVLRGAAGFERRVALKKILPVYAGMEEFAKLFRDEARISAVLNHSGIVQVYDFGTHRGDHWIAMEFVDGPDLEEVLDRCRRRGIHPPVDVVIHLGHRLASALEYAHGVSDPDGGELLLVHRDVSPPNILLSVQGDVKLTDFGVAKATVRDSATRPGVLRGKYAYMSPEQVQHKPIDHRSDLFGLGILLYETLTGVNPFEGSTDYQTIESVGRAEVEPAGFLRPDTPTELDRILLGLLEPDPELRYQSGGELRRDLAALMLERPEADEPATLVEFLRELFPERAPPGVAGKPVPPGPPLWESLAHLLSAADVEVPRRFPEGPGAGVRLEERPPLLDSLWASAPISGEEWGAIVNAPTASGVEPADEPVSQQPDATWEDVSASEWAVEGEDPEGAMPATQPLAPVPIRLTADTSLPPLPWADPPGDEAAPDFDDEDDETLEDTDPNLTPVSLRAADRSYSQGDPDASVSRWDMSLEWEGDGDVVVEPKPQPQADVAVSEWGDSEPPKSAVRRTLPVPEAPPPVADALLRHVRVQPDQSELGLPDINEWDLGESAFDPAAETSPDGGVATAESPAAEGDGADRRIQPASAGREVRGPSPTPPDAEVTEPPNPSSAPDAEVTEPPNPSSAPDAETAEPPKSAMDTEQLAFVATAARGKVLPDGPIKKTVVDEVGKPAIARAPGMESTRGLPAIGHRRRGRVRTEGAEDGEVPRKKMSRKVDLGLADTLPEIPPEEAAALELARGRPLSKPVLAIGAAILLLLPVGLLIGARRLEQIQRDRAVPQLALRPGVVFQTDTPVDELPLLEPLAPIRAPDP